MVDLFIMDGIIVAIAGTVVVSSGAQTIMEILLED